METAQTGCLSSQ